MEDNKTELPVLMTPAAMEVKINTAVAPRKLSIAGLETRALQLVKNEDNIKEMAALLKDIDDMENIATETHKTTKKPYADAAKACDDGKKLVFEHTDRIRDMVKPDYDRILADIDARKRKAALKEAQDKAIMKGIEDTVTGFAKLIVAAANLKDLSDIERRINLEKSPSREKKYGDFFSQAKKQFDEVLLPIIRNQKTKLKLLTALHGELEEAVSDSEEAEVGRLQETIGEVSLQIKENQASAGDILLVKEFLPAVEAQEVLPEIRTKRTDISYEIADAAVALKKVPELLTITVNNKEAKKVAAKLKEQGAFEGKDEVIIDGIKYIITRRREAL